ncbi:MAG: DUF2378 family protein [Sandaracinaceae bacterium]|nr:DUF2378 family protein [Sandaracinaceae bacterium]
MDERQRLLDEISEYCDLRVRLATIPPSAKWRGVYFNAVSGVLERAGKLGEYQRLMPETYSPLRMYPAGELLEHVAVAGALLRSPQDVHAGMHEVGRDNALYFARSLLGRTMLRLLDEDPYRVLQQGVAGRRQSATYGRWRLERTGERSALMHFEQEYGWIESYMLGAGIGTFESVGVTGSFEVELDGPYDGRHVIRW